MATIPKFPPSFPRAPVIEQLAQELQKTDGSMTAQKNGVVFKNRGEGQSLMAPWDMSKEWSGAELTIYDWRVSHWSKTIVVRFFVAAPPYGISAFTLHLTPPLSDDEVRQIAETYMMVLNMRRREKEK